MKDKIDWEKIWKDLDRWMDRRFDRGKLTNWREGRDQTKKLVERQLAGKKRRKS